MTVMSSNEMKNNERICNRYTTVGNYDIISTATARASQYEATQEDQDLTDHCGKHYHHILPRVLHP